MEDKLTKLREEKAIKLEAARNLLDDAEGIVLSEEDQAVYDAMLDEVKRLNETIVRHEQQEKAERELAMTQIQPVYRTAPYHNKIKLGDSEARAMGHFLRTGDAGGLEIRASNDTDMNIGTDADGGYAVPTGHYRDIIARRDESMLASMLGIRNIPGVGTTVNVPIDNEADGEFVSTNEAASTDRDAPALNQKAMTLVKYTKRVELSWELLEDEDSRLLAFLSDFVGRGMAKTHNNLLLTEVAANGTNFDTFAGAAAIAAGEPENMVSNADLSHYLDDSRSVGWVMRSSTLWAIRALTGNNRLYAEQNAASLINGGLLGYPVHFSNKAAAIGASAVSMYFGNWNYVGFREAPGFTVLRDPYSKASTGQVVLHYYFRTVYGVLQAEAIGYGDHPSA